MRSWALAWTKAIGDVRKSIVIAPVPHLKKSFAPFNKKPFPSGVSHRDSDY